MPVPGRMSNFPRRGPYFPVPICHISPPTTPILVIFYIDVVLKRPSSWSNTPLGPISLRENQEKGCQKGEKNNLHRIYFLKARLVPCDEQEVLLSCFGVKRGPGWAAVACNVGTQCQNLNWISAQTTGVVRLSPNFVDHLVMLFKTICIKKITSPEQLLR